MRKTILEVATDKIGNILWIEDYQFSRLFGVGQEQIMNSKTYYTVSCKKIGTIVYHVLRRSC